nr:group I intron-associated PD-(D/E)XK endonuclease [uncultured Arsenicibacter sp.]
MLTKQKGDIAEQAVILQALKSGWGVCKPIGDRLPYDIILDIDRTLYRIQVKYAWFDAKTANYVVDTRRTKTNRRRMLRENYSLQDFDFAIIYLEPLHIFYIFPVSVFIAYSSSIHLVEAEKRQRRPESADFREAWHLLMR